MQHWELFFVFLIISFVYSAVGFGGKSSYMMILGLYAFSNKEIYLIAVICNIIVVLSSSYVFFRKNELNWKRIVPILVFSIPLSLLGATFKIVQNNAFIILACNLLLIATVLLIKSKASEVHKVSEINKYSFIKDGIIGGYIGFLSSLLHVGGGIFLAPLLNFRKWDTPKKIASTASMFVLANSICGIIMQTPNIPVNLNYTRLIVLCLAVLIGGQLGARFGAYKLSLLGIRRLTAVLVFVTGIELLFKYLPVVLQNKWGWF